MKKTRKLINCQIRKKANSQIFTFLLYYPILGKPNSILYFHIRETSIYIIPVSVISPQTILIYAKDL